MFAFGSSSFHTNIQVPQLVALDGSISLSSLYPNLIIDSHQNRLQLLGFLDNNNSVND